MRTRFRRYAVVAVVSVVALCATTVPHAHAAPPLRSGTIVGGWFPFAVALAPGGTPECDWNVDCIAWRASDCDRALSGRDPAVFASIVDVRKLAGLKKKRMFRVFPRAAKIMWGGVGVEFWSRDCSEIVPYPSIPLDISVVHFRIPVGAAWMTVASVDDTTFDWQLY